MSDIKVAGFKVRSSVEVSYTPNGSDDPFIVQSSELIAGLDTAFKKFSDAEKQDQLKKVCTLAPSPIPPTLTDLSINLSRSRYPNQSTTSCTPPDTL
jgi:hypothetical protein